jgi:hypothetical protein
MKYSDDVNKNSDFYFYALSSFGNIHEQGGRIGCLGIISINDKPELDTEFVLDPIRILLKTVIL